jgi:hypothetical protein
MALRSTHAAATTSSYEFSIGRLAFSVANEGRDGDDDINVEKIVECHVADKPHLPRRSEAGRPIAPRGSSRSEARCDDLS